MKRLSVYLCAMCLSFVFGQTALELEHHIPDWNGGQMTLYFDLAIYPEVYPDGSFSFPEDMTEQIEFWLEYDKRWTLEDLFPFCFDDADDELEATTDLASFWLFRIARLNQRTDGTNDGIAQLLQENGYPLSFMYADRTVDVRGRCRFDGEVFVDVVLELSNEVRYVKFEEVSEGGDIILTTNVPAEAIANAVWVASIR